MLGVDFFPRQFHLSLVQMATHYSILAWKTAWTEQPGGYSQKGHRESDTTE